MSLYEINEKKVDEFFEIIESFGLNDEQMGELGVALAKLLGKEKT